MSTTSLIRYAGEKCGFEYGRTILTLDAWASGIKPVENAKGAIRTLRDKRARYGGTHFVVESNGVIRSVEPLEVAA